MIIKIWSQLVIYKCIVKGKDKQGICIIITQISAMSNCSHELVNDVSVGSHKKGYKLIWLLIIISTEHNKLKKSMTNLHFHYYYETCIFN